MVDEPLDERQERLREVVRLEARRAFTMTVNGLGQRWAPLGLPAAVTVDALILGMFSNAMDLAAVLATQREDAAAKWRHDRATARAAAAKLVECANAVFSECEDGAPTLVMEGRL